MVIHCSIDLGFISFIKSGGLIASTLFALGHVCVWIELGDCEDECAVLNTANVRPAKANVFPAVIV